MNCLSPYLVVLRTFELHGAGATLLQVVQWVQVPLDVLPDAQQRTARVRHLAVVYRLFLHISPETVRGVVMLGRTE